MTAERQVAIRLLGSPLWAVRVAWLALGAVAVGLWAVTSVRILREPFLPAAEVSDPSTFTLEDVEVLRSLGLPEALAMAPIVFFLLLDVVYLAVGAWIFWRRPDDTVALLVSFALVILGAVVMSYAFVVVGSAYPQWSPVPNALLLAGVVAIALILYAFPDGQFVPRWTRFLPIPLGALLLLFMLPLPEAMRQAAGTSGMLGIVATGAYARIYRYRYASSPVQRQQSKWVGLGLLGFAVGMSLWFASLAIFPPDRPGLGRLYFLMALLPFAAVVGVLLPTSVAIAVLRHRLWEIDIVLQRTAVYGPLTGILMGLYVGSIRLFQALFLRFTGEQSDFSILFSTLVLAGAFMPLRIRLQNLADKYFRESPSPGRELRALGEQIRSLAQLADVGHVTRRLLDEAVAAYHAESGAVFLLQGDDLRLVQTAGAWRGEAEINVPLEHAGARLGQLALGPRHRGQGYTPQDAEGLQEVAQAAAQVLALATRVG